VNGRCVNVEPPFRVRERSAAVLHRVAVIAARGDKGALHAGDSRLRERHEKNADDDMEMSNVLGWRALDSR